MKALRVRTRYAPSPTGFLHIGGARTALFSYLFAKHMGGDFIFRLEDTDIERNISSGETSQLKNLAWLGIIPDESPLHPNEKYGPYRQSEKLAIYQKYVDELIAKDLAYKAYDTIEELEVQRLEQESKGLSSFRYDRRWLKIGHDEQLKREQNKAYVVRLALKPNFTYTWEDLVRGAISVATSEIGDWVIMKANGYPTYNFAVVIDDYQMAITHVLRGEEHITNTPKQLAVYDALGWEPPQFGHLTIITNMEGKKLSKRDTSLKQFVEDFRNDGFIPEAVFNFLALLGWTHPHAKEILTPSELIAAFEIGRLSKAPSKFDNDKLLWFGREYFKKASPDWVKANLKFPTHVSQAWIDLFVQTYQISAPSLKDMANHLASFVDQSVVSRQTSEVVKVFSNQLASFPFTIDGINQALQATKQQTKLQGKELFLPLREVMTNASHGPELAKAIFLTGQDLVWARLKACK